MPQFKKLTKKLYVFVWFLARISEYAIAGKGYCNDWVYLPEGGYPSLLTISDPLYNEDRIKECMNRCLHASSLGLSGSKGEYETRIRDHAFYIRHSDQGCGCSSGTCSDRKSSGYTSYYTASGNFTRSIFWCNFKLLYIKLSYKT